MIEKNILINNKIFKLFQNTQYYCSIDGEIYSNYSHRILKPMLRGQKNKKYYYIDINFGEGQVHYPIHKIVYETWIGPIPTGASILHKDDDQLNNNINNLYLGDQKKNIQDCIYNGHRVGDTWILTIYDKKIKQTLTFCPASSFIKYSNHPCKNGNVKRMFSRKWFKKRYDIISYYLCKDIQEKESVTTNPDECKDVG